MFASNCILSYWIAFHPTSHVITDFECPAPVIQTGQCAAGEGQSTYYVGQVAQVSVYSVFYVFVLLVWYYHSV
jgi:hypothetical protein